MADDSGFVHLHLHTTYSLLDGQCQIVPLVKRARERGMRSIAVTDHGNLYALKAFHDECHSDNAKTYGELADVKVKPILGCEAYITNGSMSDRDKNETRSHLCLHAMNKTGYHNLVKLISEAHIHGMYYKPRIDRALLEKYHEGLHCSSACLAGEVARAIVAGRMDEAEAVARWYKDLFGDAYSLEVMLHKSKWHPEMNIEPSGVWWRQLQVVKGVLELGRKLDIRVIATNDVHFIDADDNDSHDVLLALSTNKKLSDPPRIDDDDTATKSGRLVYTGEEWFKGCAEMMALFSETPEVVSNTLAVDEMIEDYELNRKAIMPKFAIPLEFGDENAEKYKPIEDPVRRRIEFEADYLDHLAWEGAKKRWNPLTDEIKERVSFELDTIRKMGFPGYFLIVSDYIRAAKEELGVWVGPGRGSAAGSAVAYALGITNVDPLKYGLLFERFLNPDRISMPDIDVDFDDYGRGRVIDYVTKKYGQDHVAHIITFGQMAAKSAIKDVGRVMEYPLADTNKLAALVPNTPKITLAKAMKESPELKAAAESKNDTVRLLMQRAMKLEGSIRQPGVHACGILISRDPLIDTIPVTPTPDEPLLTTQYDGHFVEPVGLLKMDFLGLKTLTVEKECVELLKTTRDITIDPDAIPIDDKATYELFGRGETTGLFQFESDGMKKYLRELQPDRIEDLVAMNALYRPGPLAYIPTFIDRKHGRKPVRYDHPLMETYLKDTYGVTVYQEQVMLLSRLLGGFTRGDSDTLRKAMGKKNIATMEKLKAKFEKGCLANAEFMKGSTTIETDGKEITLDLTKEADAKKLIDKIWNDWRAFAEYAFNKSHAVCYAWVAYQTGYMKAHYPAEFMCAQISSEIGNFDKMPGLVMEAAEMGLDIRTPDVNESLVRFAPGKDGKSIRYALAGIKGVGVAAAEAIVEERKASGPFKGFMDFTIRMAQAGIKKGQTLVNARVLQNLAKSGAFDSLCDEKRDLHRARFFANVDYALKRASSIAKERAMGQMDMFDMLGTSPQGGSQQDANGDEELPPAPHFAPHVCCQDERELCGIYLTGHPLGMWRKVLATLSTCRMVSPPEIPYMAEMGAERPFKIAVRVGGMLKKCDTRFSRPDPKHPDKAPQQWAILAIDDESVETEALAFAKTFEKIKDWIPNAVDTPVLLCGELQHRTNRDTKEEEEALQFVVREAYPLSEGIENFGKHLSVRIDYTSQNAEAIARQIGELAQNTPGRLALHLEVVNRGETVTIESKYKIAPTAEFFLALEKIVQPKNYRLDTIEKTFLEDAPPRRYKG